MAQVKSQQMGSDGTAKYTFSDLPNKQFAKVPGMNLYVNNNGDSLWYNKDTKQYERTSVTPRTQWAVPTSSTYESGTQAQDMEDGNTSSKIITSLNTKYKMTKGSGINEELNYNDPLTSLMHQNNLFRSDELDLYNKTYRFGYFNPNPLTYTKEFLFFTKPDLHIFGEVVNGAKDSNTILYPYKSEMDLSKMSNVLYDIPFWRMLASNNRKTIALLQASLPNNIGGNRQDPFNHLLQNQCISNLEVPSLSSEMVETATNTYGVGFAYRGSSEASDDKPTFSLEFKDTKYLDVYYYFKAFEEYETLKHHGIIAPFKEYIEERTVHDQMAIYKFLVDEDMETILYYGKMYGVVPKSLPRDVFGTTQFDNGLSYSIDFEAAFYEDMKPDIIKDFNELSKSYYNSKYYRIDTYNNRLDAVDNRATQAAFVEVTKVSTEDVASNRFLSRSPGGYVFKLKWKGDDKV